ncbi:MAG: sigma-70 family RNA polymerase sigma factor [Bacteroidota bacterium]
MSSGPYIESQLVARLQARDKQALTEIYRRFGGNLLGIIHRIVGDQAVAEDVLQEALVKVWRNADRYDASRGQLFTWLLNICRNAAIDKLRSREFKRQRVTDGIDRSFQQAGSEPAYSLNPDLIGLRDWVKKLDQKYVEIIDLVYFSGMTHVEAAEALALPLGTVKTRIRSAISELRKQI